MFDGPTEVGYRTNSLFARLFGLFLTAIGLAHLLGTFWVHQYGHPQHPPPPPPPDCDASLFPLFSEFQDPFVDWGGLGPPPPPPMLGGPDIPVVLLGLQLIALIWAAWFSARLLTRPIRHLSEAAERLSENLDSPPLTEQGPEELCQAARAFNAMQGRIREQIGLRSRMLTAVSHDLRTPLARMKLRIEQVEDEALRQRLAQDLGEMANLLESTLSYVQAQSAHEPWQRLDVQALVESLVENAQDNGEDARVTGVCMPLSVQPLALRSCLSNLITNALRYAGHAQVQLFDTRSQLIIRVVDQGPGIPLRQREAVFEPFFRMEGSRNRDSGGSGLGLTIAREAARRQGGDLTLEETQGGGLTAVLTLPRHEPRSA